MPALESDATHRIVIRPHRSITAKGLCAFYAGVTAPALGLAWWFAVQGYWPVLACALVEMLLLALCLWLCRRQTRYVESIVIDGDRVVVEKGDARRRERREYNRYWAQVVEQIPAARLHPHRLLIRSHGQECEVGACLSEAEREILKHRLADLIRPT
ncbi:MAG TPA: DUF2244 domain-containing protein [Gammaproteobacteria bacterium]|nr:DUF2244 domain-containing protein [Gammaproteobacteria bacterium]